MSTRSALANLVKQFVGEDPARAAHYLESLPEADAAKVLGALSHTLSAEVFRCFEARFAAGLLKEMGPELFGAVASRLDSQQAAEILRHLPEDRRGDLLDRIPEKAREQMREILTYPENSAGRIMVPDFLAFHSDAKVRSVIQKIRMIARKGLPVSYAYVVDSENKLAGVMNMRDLMLASPDAVLETMMRREVFSVQAFTDREEVADQLSKRRYFAVPVVDPENRLIGVIKAEHLIEDVQEEATEDLQKMFGAGGSERAFSPLGFSLARRLPWLHVNLATAFLAGAVVALFSEIIGKIPVLAVYLPVVAGQGGNAGAQSLVVVIRGLVMREIPPAKVRRLILKEAGIGVLNGILIGSVTGVAAWLWHGNPFLGLVVALAMLVNLVIAGVTGAAIPLTMKALRLDPAQCSNIILTTFTDVMGFLALLGFGVLFKDHL